MVAVIIKCGRMGDLVVQKHITCLTVFLCLPHKTKVCVNCYSYYVVSGNNCLVENLSEFAYSCKIRLFICTHIIIQLFTIQLFSYGLLVCVNYIWAEIQTHLKKMWIIHFWL